jgi:hypothetical protein
MAANGKGKSEAELVQEVVSELQEKQNKEGRRQSSVSFKFCEFFFISLASFRA